MAAKKHYPVHPDFAHYPAFPFPFTGWVVNLLNRYLHLDTFIRQRAIKRKAIHHSVKGPEGHTFDVWQFMPDKHKAGEKLPAILYLHGGAFVLTYASTHVQAMDYYANQAHCAVFMVDYRLAPEHVFPAGFNDCYTALEWLAKQASSLCIDASNIIVMGDSAGGALSAGLAQKALDAGGPAIKAQVLVYPALDHTCSTRTARKYEGTPLFDSVANRRMWEVYLKDYAGKNIPTHAAPASRQNLAGLPPAYVENAEFDPLSDEAAEYARRLEAAEVAVEFNRTKGTVHGFDTVLTSPIAEDALQRRIAYICRAVSS